MRRWRTGRLGGLLARFSAPLTNRSSAPRVDLLLRREGTSRNGRQPTADALPCTAERNRSQPAATDLACFRGFAGLVDLRLIATPVATTGLHKGSTARAPSESSSETGTLIAAPLSELGEPRV
jgi:hypothetical protein